MWAPVPTSLSMSSSSPRVPSLPAPPQGLPPLFHPYHNCQGFFRSRGVRPAAKDPIWIGRNDWTDITTQVFIWASTVTHGFWVLLSASGKSRCWTILRRAKLRQNTRKMGIKYNPRRQKRWKYTPYERKIWKIHITSWCLKSSAFIRIVLLKMCMFHTACFIRSHFIFKCSLE